MARSVYERKAQKELESQNCLVDWKIRPSGWKMPRGYNVDYFGIADLLYYEPKEKILGFVAIKGHSGVPSELRKKVEDFKPQKFVKEIWTFGRNKKVRKEIIE